ncbi:Uncharacterised protein [Mycobacteroides abscessus subsp. abscessus]|nr:Uncharacterised protein [Mycobacteroides abscessus subsp. abscessus]
MSASASRIVMYGCALSSSSPWISSSLPFRLAASAVFEIAALPSALRSPW